MNIKILPFIH